MADASEIYTPPEEILKNTGPSMVADLFRLYLMQKTDEIWVDTDMVAIKPMTLTGNGFAVGYEAPNKSICNAVLRTPRDSASIQQLIHYVENPHNDPQWLRPVLRARLADAPKRKLLTRLYKIKRSSMGPLAVGHALRDTGEVSEVRAREAYYSVPWQFCDVLFNPYGGTEGWMSEETEAVHLWAHALSNYHKVHRPHPESFVGKAQQELKIDVSHLKRQQLI
ncbi:hypothetical protein [uncultured Aliiroseovarius sp.]|uniref:hypothetical protein n=1 Tax=uncultured Aliiroseovarius sp. TaxID=1658783 RepID=UPI00260FD41B|nr:hypothetical protein [uncultured Aliiroseovarius sp.]